MRNRMKRWTREWLRARMKTLGETKQEAPQVDLNIGFRPMPDGFYKQLLRADFDQSMERGWKQLVTQVKRTPAHELIKTVQK